MWWCDRVGAPLVSGIQSRPDGTPLAKPILFVKSRRNRHLDICGNVRAFLACLLLLLGAAAPDANAQNSIATGLSYYTTNNVLVTIPALVAQKKCSECHFATNPPVGPTPTLTQGQGTGSRHPEAANNPALIKSAFGTGGTMTLYLGSAAIASPNASQLDIMFKLALYIGQFKQPAFKLANDPSLAMSVRSGATAVNNVYPSLVDDGGTHGLQTTSGTAQDVNGLVISTPASHASSVTAAQVDGMAMVAYNISYTSAAGYTGADSFGLTVQNPSGAATQSIPVTVYGISSGTTATGKLNQAFLYTITSNDTAASGFSASIVGAPGVSLASLGLSVGATSVGGGVASAPISGTIAANAPPGTYTLRVQTSISATTVGANSGVVTKDVTLTIADLTMNVGASNVGTTLNFNQNQAIPTHQVSGNPATVVPASSYTISSVPSGLSFSTGSGQLTGTPSVSGSYTPTVTANSNFGALTRVFTINVASAGAPTVTTAPALSTSAAVPTLIGTRGTLISPIDIVATNLSGSMSYAGTGLPAGLSVAGSQLVGTATVSGDFPISLSATNGVGAGFGTGTVNAVIRINPTQAPVISGTSAVSTPVNSAMANYQIVASDPPILSYSLVSPLPIGLSLNTSSGVISGTPTASGIVATTVRATNPVNNSNDFVITFTIVPTSAPVVTIGSLPSPIGVRNSAITPVQITATNPAILSYNQTGFPTGLSINGSGQIVGTPTQSGDFPVLINATNAASTSSNLSVTIRVNPDAAPVISGASTVNANANQPFGGYQISASNPPILSYALAGASTLPAGLSLNTSTGAISGTPTTSGPVTTTLTASNAFGTSSNFVLTWNIIPTSLPQVTSNLPVSPLVMGVVGTPVSSFQISATNPPITTYGATGLAGGLSVNASGQIVGTPTQSGDFAVDLSATNAFGSGHGLLTVRVSPSTAPTITSAATVTRSVNAASGLVYQIVASNPVITNYAVVAPSVLPAGLNLDANTGAISGSPSVSGISTTTLRATNAAGPGAPFVLTFTINPVLIPVVTAAVPLSPAVTGTVGSPITPIPLVATNPAITAYGASGLPAGLSVDVNTGLLSGTPTQSGDFQITLGASNIVGASLPLAVQMRINPNAVPVISSAASISTTFNQVFAGYQIVANNLPIVSYAVVAPSALPAGLSLNSLTGAITGTATTSGVVSTTLRATNVAGNSNPFVLTFTVVPTLVPVVTAPVPVAPAIIGSVGTAITPIQVSATNPPITNYSASGLPSGLSVNPSTGVLSGTPTQSGDFSVVLGASNAAGSNSAAAVVVRVNPNTVPVINSAASVSATANTVFAGYQITATNGPLTSFAVVAPSVLPAGLSLNTSTGAISGTPTASGAFSTAIAASNAAGASAALTLAFTISPNAVPSITSPTFATVAAGVAIAPIQIVATNPVIQSYRATGLPSGLSINTSTGVISGTPLVTGTFAVTLSAINSVGPGSRVVPFTIGIPAPTACAMSVPLNTAVTLDLASCLFNGFSPTGVTIVATAAHGLAVANGTRVTYTPVHNYFGADAFSFVGFGAGGTSPQGMVSVTITGRPDPTQDVAVTALIGAQAETAQRFSRAQMSNFQRRMESLHAGGASEASAGATSLRAGVLSGPAQGFGSSAPAATAATSLITAVLNQVAAAAGATAAPAAPSNLGVVSHGMPGGTVFNPGNASASPSDSQIIEAVATGLGVKSLPFADSVFSLLKSRSLSLSGVASGLGLNTPVSTTGNTSYWMEGVASFGTRDANGSLSGSEFSSNGISVGADRRLGDQLVVGLGLGYARDKTRIGTDGTNNRSRGYSLAVYGSYQPTPNTFIDGLLGVGSLDFNTTRFVAPINDFALGQRSGRQLFGSLTGGYEFRDKALLVSPYGRIDFSSDRLRNSTETGAGAFALTYFGQTATSVQGALGVRGESVHATSFGYAVPRLRAEYLHEFRGNGQAFIGFADQPGGPRYALASTGTGRDSVVFGIGSDFMMRDGLTLSLEYQLNHSFSNDSSYALRVRLTKEFDAKGLPAMLKDYPVRIGAPLDLQLDAGYTVDDNVTRAKSGPDKLNDDSYSLNVSKTIMSPLTEQSRVLLTGTLGGEKFHHYNGLSRALASAEAEAQYRESSEFDDPTFALFGKVTGEAYESSLRDGYRVSAGVSIRQPLTDRISLFAALSRNIRNARSSVFSTRDNSVRANVDYALSDSQTLYLSGEYRRGDIVSSGRASLENVAIAKVFAQDDVFPGGQFFSYRFNGSTVLATVGYNLSLGSHDSIDFSWRHVRSTPGLRPSFVASPRNYLANQLSAVYLMRF